MPRVKVSFTNRPDFPVLSPPVCIDFLIFSSLGLALVKEAGGLEVSETDEETRRLGG